MNNLNPLLEGEDPVIEKEVREAIYEFGSIVAHEKELSSDAIMINHMKHFARSEVLRQIMEGRPSEEIVEYLKRAAQSFKGFRNQMTGNPIHVFRREHT